MWIIDFIEAIGYLGISILMFLETYVPIIQSEMVMAFSGYASMQGELNLWLVVLAGVIGSQIGALSLYAVASLLDEHKVVGWIKRHGVWIGLLDRDVVKLNEWFRRHQEKSVLYGRLIPGIRSAIAIPAGLQRMPLWKFFIYNAIGVMIWVSALTALGYMLADQYRLVSRYSSYFTYVFIAFLALLIVYRVIKIRRSKLDSR